MNTSALMLSWSLYATASSQGAVAPKVGMSCYNSSAVLGTSNTMPDTRALTTVVNVWAFTDRTDFAVAWILKNAAGKYYFQANYHRTQLLKDVLEPATFSRYVYLQYGPTSPASDVMLDPKASRVIVNQFRQHHLFLRSCFLGDLPVVP